MFQEKKGKHNTLPAQDNLNCLCTDVQYVGLVKLFLPF